ncbi:hypothetical protein O3M35_009510 [Rhynocoris fuscipes]|uniref:Vacuolar protein sorting-associated protein 51 homolog n=1 Tax=Rhynocoris fuscipes TaxID=488301 RepID=A0AAW1D935_9HEMI
MSTTEQDSVEVSVENRTKAVGGNPYDLNGQHFNPDMYLQKLLKEHSLKEIMEQEEAIVRDTQSLHSDMQTLVYENYNKFISATDTIKKMKSDFKQMETEMDLLGKNMDSITSFSDQISTTLKDTRQQIAKLSGVHSLLKRLQFLFKLPNKLKTLMEEGNYSQAVEDYIVTQQVLEHYAHLESFRGIQDDCIKIVDDLRDRLHGQFKSKEIRAKELTEAVELLLRLGEPAETLYSQFLTHATSRLQDQLFVLKSENSGEDLLEFVDLANNGFICDLCLIVTSYNDMFLNPEKQNEETEKALKRQNSFIEERMTEFFNCLEDRVKSSQERSDILIIVRALSSLYTRINSLTSLFKTNRYAKETIKLIGECADREAQTQLLRLDSRLKEWIRGARQGIAQETAGQSAGELSAGLVINIVDGIKASLNHLTLFIQPDVPFASGKEFAENFSIKSVREGLIVTFLQNIVETAHSFTNSQTVPLPTLLLLANMCLEFSNTHVQYLLSLVDEWFNISSTKERASKKDELCTQMQKGAQDLVNHYVRMQGNIISQMLRKSIETRDWVHSLEPRTVRPVMKRVLEELASAETLVGSLFEDGARPPGSDHQHRSVVGTSVWTQSTTTAHGYSHNLHKLFSDKIEIYSPVEFTKVSVLTGIIKIGLKTLLECVRLKTFSKYGLQQVQVDTHYLQLYLWRYVSDENIVHLLLDEILSSTVHRCIQPVLMEPSVVEIICERG